MMVVVMISLYSDEGMTCFRFSIIGEVGILHGGMIPLQLFACFCSRRWWDGGRERGGVDLRLGGTGTVRCSHFVPTIVIRWWIVMITGSVVIFVPTLITFVALTGRRAAGSTEILQETSTELRKTRQEMIETFGNCEFMKIRSIRTSIGLTVIFRAESSQAISASAMSSCCERWCAARIRITPRTIIKRRNPTQTTMMTVTAWVAPTFWAIPGEDNG